MQIILTKEEYNDLKDDLSEIGKKYSELREAVRRATPGNYVQQSHQDALMALYEWQRDRQAEEASRVDLEEIFKDIEDPCLSQQVGSPGSIKRRANTLGRKLHRLQLFVTSVESALDGEKTDRSLKTAHGLRKRLRDALKYYARTPE